MEADDSGARTGPDACGRHLYRVDAQSDDFRGPAVEAEVVVHESDALRRGQVHLLSVILVAREFALQCRKAAASAEESSNSE